jgi:hypothetical protein
MKTRSYLARRWAPTKRRRYIVRPIDTFVTAQFNWSKDLHKDSERVLGHNIRLYKLWNEKVFMVQHAIKLNPYNTSCFAWTDIGSFREKSELPKYAGFPDARTFRHHKVTFLMVDDFRKKETKNISRIDERFMFKARIGGGVFAGGITALRKFAQLHLQTIREAKSLNVFAGKDQSLFAFEILRHPELFDLVRPLPDVYDLWFSLHLQFSSQMAGILDHIPHPTVTFKS